MLQWRLPLFWQNGRAELPRSVLVLGGDALPAVLVIHYSKAFDQTFKP